jgi:hypothetical protein
VTERLPSDHDAVESHRCHLESVGRTSRCRVPLPDGLGLADGDVIRVSLEGEAAHAHLEQTLAGDLAISAAFDNPRLARAEGEGADRLADWLTDSGLGAGDPLLVDVVTEGYALGLRRPGERVIYTAVDPPSDSLADIAQDLDG